jgi:UDP-N-acetyl-2-amino-2-deoxyglucuronate dehydrogenase
VCSPDRFNGIFSSVMSTPLRLGIVGSGGIAHTHAEAISGLPETQLAGICSRNPKSAQELASAWHAPTFQQLETMLPSVDAVLIATPSGAHEETAVAALRAGKHVLCEKPLEISSERVARMIQEAEKAGLILAGFFPMRCGTGVKAIREALDAGRFGRLTFLSARIKWWRDENYYRSSSWRGTWELDGGGALMNQGIHAVDLLQWLGGPVRAATGYSATLAHAQLAVEDTLSACFQFESGALGTIAAATSCHPGLDLSLEISGDRGSAVLVNDRLEFWKFADGDDSRRAPGQDAGAVRGGTSDPRAISCEGHRQQIAEFCRAILGLPAATISGREAGKAVAIIEAIYRSTRSGKSERVILS